MLGSHLITWDFFQPLATGFTPYPSGSLMSQAAGCLLGSLCPFQRGFTLLLGCGSVSSCQNPLHLSFAGQRKAPGRNHHLPSCENRSAGCNPSLPGRKNNEWPYKKGRAFPKERALQAEAVKSWGGKFLVCLLFLWDKISGWRFLCPLR